MKLVVKSMGSITMKKFPSDFFNPGFAVTETKETSCIGIDVTAMV